MEINVDKSDLYDRESLQTKFIQLFFHLTLILYLF